MSNDNTKPELPPSTEFEYPSENYKSVAKTCSNRVDLDIKKSWRTISNFKTFLEVREGFSLSYRSEGVRVLNMPW
eukprot:CAMPEP_0184688422 /NCGR_PEP_ID=MMETSP0312-20130426/29835_1 /TAXON_ID=31354 /ORGANISM="Compsopogon coeruleus, Strain SAG 36.94" /LENGTH=74 /DNA_ID=CAMNT_0027145567 /DNA_START=408 /DNA_END=629 /DNA_ORIENTATION=+